MRRLHNSHLLFLSESRSAVELFIHSFLRAHKQKQLFYIHACHEWIERENAYSRGCTYNIAQRRFESYMLCSTAVWNWNELSSHSRDFFRRQWRGTSLFAERKKILQSAWAASKLCLSTKAGRVVKNFHVDANTLNQHFSLVAKTSNDYEIISLKLKSKCCCRPDQAAFVSIMLIEKCEFLYANIPSSLSTPKQGNCAHALVCPLKVCTARWTMPRYGVYLNNARRFPFRPRIAWLVSDRHV